MGDGFFFGAIEGFSHSCCCCWVAGGSSGDDDSQWRAVGVDPDDERVAVGGSNGVGNDME